MPQVQLEDELFELVKRRASDEGYTSVDEYITDVLVEDIGDRAGNVDHLFTPERLAELERISAEVHAGGKTYTLAEVAEYFEKKREECLANRAG